MNKIIKSNQEWKKILSDEEYSITRQKGTEPAFSGKAFDISKDGVFKCRCCGAQLFERTSKYESGCGWPSFFKVISNDAIKTEQVYRAPVSNNGGPNPRASKGGRNTAQQIEAPSATISSEETLFDFDNTALLDITILQKIQAQQIKPCVIS